MAGVVVVGGGLVGTLAAVYLSRLGHRVEVFERHPDPRQARPSASNSINLTLCARGLAALDEVGVGERVRARALPAYGRIVHAADGTRQLQPYGPRREAILSISRAELGRILIEFAGEQPGVELRFGERCLEVDAERPAVLLQEVSSRRCRWRSCDRLLAADGAHSQIRAQLARSGQLAVSVETIPQAYTELAVPPLAGEWALDPDAIHVWPRGQIMLIGFANFDRSFTLALHLPFEGEDSFESIRQPLHLERLFQSAFPDALPLVPRLAEQFFAVRGRPMVTVRCRPWVLAGKLALIGDAAHAIVPSYGQGANCGFEDCLVLAECLRQAEGDFEVAWQRWQESRMADADAIAELALEHFVELQEQLGRPEFLLRKAVERRLTALYPDSYVPLYSMISFTGLSYCEARRREQAQKAIVDRILALAPAAAVADEARLDEPIRQVLSQTAPPSVGPREPPNASGEDPCQ